MIYEYLCKDGHVSQRECKIVDREDFVKCDECGKDAKRIISATSFALKGDGWHKDGYQKANP